MDNNNQLILELINKTLWL